MYNENSIKVLTQDEADNKFPWAKIESLAIKHSIPVECIKRGFEACFQIDLDPQFYIDKYILNKPLEINTELETVYKELIRKRR